VGVWINPSDLGVFTAIAASKAEAMIEDAEAWALFHAPRLADLPVGDPKLKVLKAILRRAILRWDEAGNGGKTSVSIQNTGGPYSQAEQTSFEQTKTSRGVFYPSEVEDLKALVAEPNQGKAYSLDRFATGAGNHSDACTARLGGPCSCGLTTIGAPLYSGGGL